VTAFRIEPARMRIERSRTEHAARAQRYGDTQSSHANL
jgi:hypothetical protein